MSKAKVGTGELTPFKKGDTGSTSIGGSTSKEHVREGFTPNVNIDRASNNVTELTPFKSGPSGPGGNRNEDHPAFHERDGALPNPHGYKAFKE
jgi:hypothetical protein